jgi:hypothetical protein
LISIVSVSCTQRPNCQHSFLTVRGVSSDWAYICSERNLCASLVDDADFCSLFGLLLARLDVDVPTLEAANKVDRLSEGDSPVQPVGRLEDFERAVPVDRVVNTLDRVGVSLALQTTSTT